MNKQRGLSIIELMVAMLVGLILMGGVIQVFLSSKRTYSFQESLARIQETGRIGQEFLARDIRMAGYNGCAGGDYGELTNTLRNNTSVNYDFSSGLKGFDNITANPDSTTLNPAPLLGTDILVVRGPVGDGVKVVDNNNGAQLFADVTSTEVGACADGTNRISGICQGDILVVADCTKARIFQTANLQVTSGALNVTHPATGEPGNDPSSWGGSSAPENERFGVDAEIIKMNTVYYYVANNPGGQPALYQRIVPGAANEVVEGVENLQFSYGRDTNDDGVPDSYESAAQVDAANAWKSITAVRIEMLVRGSENGVTDQAQTYNFNGADVTPTDKRLRHVFVSTVGVRARLP